MGIVGAHARGAQTMRQALAKSRSTLLHHHEAYNGEGHRLACVARH
jgi:hypothetical protein